MANERDAAAKRCANCGGAVSEQQPIVTDGITDKRARLKPSTVKHYHSDPADCAARRVTAAIEAATEEQGA